MDLVVDDAGWAWGGVDRGVGGAGGWGGRGGVRRGDDGGGGQGRCGGIGRGGGGAAGRDRGRSAPKLDLLLGHPYLAFKDDTTAFHHCEKFGRMEIGVHAAIDWSTLEEVKEAVRARDFIRHDASWSRLFNLVFLPSDRMLVIEFLSLFEFHPRPVDQPEEADNVEDPQIEVSFYWRGCGMICLLGSLPRTLTSIRC
ncbi:hypothetical protein Hdeb2414_s0015g00440761 [Helianthus debilis subsp. tardiflorus]